MRTCKRSVGCGALIGVALLAAAVAAPARAALIEVDLNAAGDKLITRDTAQGLDFLDVNLSFNEIVGGAGGWTALGFRHATLAEVDALYRNFGLTGVFDGFTVSTANQTTGMNLVKTVGCTFTCWAALDNQHQYGIADDPASILIGMGEVTLTNTNGFARARVYLGNAHTLDGDFKSEDVGNYLVRAAPPSVSEPAPLALLALGLLALGLSRRIERRRPSH